MKWIFLLDGQQRTTILINTFTNYLYEYKYYKLDDVHDKLKNRFFLKLDINVEKMDIDLFGLKIFKFPYIDRVDKIPNFTSYDIQELIEIIPFSNKDEKTNIFHPFTDIIDHNMKNKLKSECCSRLNIKGGAD